MAEIEDAAERAARKAAQKAQQAQRNQNQKKKTWFRRKSGSDGMEGIAAQEKEVERREEIQEDVPATGPPAYQLDGYLEAGVAKKTDLRDLILSTQL